MAQQSSDVLYGSRSTDFSFVYFICFLWRQNLKRLEEKKNKTNKQKEMRKTFDIVKIQMIKLFF